MIHHRRMLTPLRTAPWHARLRHGAAMTACLIALACADLTRIDAPDLVQPRDLETATGAEARRAGALAQFATAYARQVGETGAFTDEFTDAATAFYATDQRTLSSTTTTYPFAALSLARINALRAAMALQQYSPATPARIAEMYAIAAFVEIILAENACEPVPLAKLVDGLPVESPTYSRDQLLAAAVAHIDSGTTFITAADPMMNLLRLGRGRALLNRGDYDGAAAAVADVPLTYAYRVLYSATVSTQLNDVYQQVVVLRNLTVADREGKNGLPFVSGRDPRVVTTLLGPSRFQVSVYNHAANASAGAPITLANGIGARLIQAEAALRRSEVERWADLLNGLRQSAITPAMPALSSDSTLTATPDERLAVHFRERAFWLFGTGARHGDLRRLVRQYGRDPEAVFPTGTYRGPRVSQLGLYGTDTSFPIAGEDPNPAYSGCEDRRS